MLTDTNLNSGGKICGLKCFLSVSGEGRAERSGHRRPPSHLHHPPAAGDCSQGCTTPLTPHFGISIEASSSPKGGPAAVPGLSCVSLLPSPGEERVGTVSPPSTRCFSLLPQQKSLFGGAVRSPQHAPDSFFLSVLS